MSDITATNCGCERDCGCGGGCGNPANFFGGNGSCCNLIWILLLLSCCSGNDGCGSGFSFGGDSFC